MDVSGAFGVVGDKVRGELKGGDIEGSEHEMIQKVVIMPCSSLMKSSNIDSVVVNVIIRLMSAGLLDGSKT